ncbi:hypothetical protein EZS27_021453 [termite gut metagenome]|jgi:hypothetical protein|uniref:Uncharacterized protein n=1 Tax=termite gut metagenome TaxID=433724 RepID=A0A5J4R6J9_9ZZZZ
MEKYEVGKRFPLEKYLNKGECTVSIMNEAFFDIVVCLSGITSNEKEAFKKGKLTVALFAYKTVPFIVCDFGDGFNFDASIDIIKLTKQQQDKWLNNQGNIISLYLVNAKTGILEAMRIISVNFAEEIRDFCEKQSEYDSVYTQKVINEAYQLYQVSDMVEKAVKKMYFSRP